MADAMADVLSRRDARICSRVGPINGLNMRKNPGRPNGRPLTRLAGWLDFLHARPQNRPPLATIFLVRHALFYPRSASVARLTGVSSHPLDSRLSGSELWLALSDSNAA